MRDTWLVVGLWGRVEVSCNHSSHPITVPQPQRVGFRSCKGCHEVFSNHNYILDSILRFAASLSSNLLPSSLPEHTPLSSPQSHIR
jgi:hypothetical protein